METEIVQKYKAQAVPKLRFREFNKEWTKRKLGELGHFKGGGTPDTKIEKYWKGDIPWISSSDLTEDDIHNIKIQKWINKEAVKQTATKIIPKNSILLISRVGVGKLAINEEDICTSQDFSNFLPTEANSYYLGYYLIARKNLLTAFSQGTSIKGFTTSDIKDLKINLPLLPEQQKIASFLSAVDKKIQQLTRKKALLETYKKGVMQQLFAQEIRFKDQDGKDFPEWEEKKLKDFIVDFIVPMRDKPKDLTGNIPWCRIEDFEGKNLSKSKSNQGVTEETVKAMNLKVYPINSLLVSCSANLGFCAIVKKELVTNQTFIGLVPDFEKISVDFLYHKMKNSAVRLNKLSSGTTISYLSKKQFENFKIDYPTLKEQQKMAGFLSAFDRKIEAVSQQIEKTQTFKKGLLQQMFV